jgi:hypothetical protein
MSVLLVNLRTYFTPTAIAQTLKKLPPLKTKVMDVIFGDRPHTPLPLSGWMKSRPLPKPRPLSGAAARAFPSAETERSLTTTSRCPFDLRIPSRAKT